MTSVIELRHYNCCSVKTLYLLNIIIILYKNCYIIKNIKNKISLENIYKGKMSNFKEYLISLYYILLYIFLLKNI